jgi:hypothetical protein
MNWLELDRVLAVGYSMGRRLRSFSGNVNRIESRVWCSATRHFLRRMARNWSNENLQDRALRQQVLKEVYGSDLETVGQAGASVLRFNCRTAGGPISKRTRLRRNLGFKSEGDSCLGKPSEQGLAQSACRRPQTALLLDQILG